MLLLLNSNLISRRGLCCSGRGRRLLPLNIDFTIIGFSLFEFLSVILKYEFEILLMNSLFLSFKDQDHYAVLGLKKRRILTKDEDIKKACKSKLLLTFKMK